MSNIYQYQMSGEASGIQTWETSGEVSVSPGNWPDVAMLALKDTFMKLTKGEAVFGHPGIGCQGPYLIQKFSIVLKPE